MIQIYMAENTEFDKNGDMTLMASSVEIHAVLNGAWTATLKHPIDDEDRWKYIQEEAVVKMPSFMDDEQLFRIKSKEVTDSGVTANLEPVFMDAVGDCFLTDVRPTDKNGQQALNIMTALNSKYSGSSNITKVSTAYYEYKNLIEAINGDDDNSFINRWGGEILFDNFEVIINDRVGGDYGVDLRYGKNIKSDGLSEEIDTTDVVTRIYPKAYNGYEMTNHGYVDSELAGNYPTIKARTITFEDVKMAEDAQEDDEENGIIICDTQEELDAALTEKCKEQYAAGLDKPSVTIKADMILLKNTEQYKDFAVLEDVSLGDTIHCRHSRLGIVTDARVIELKYDSILKKVSSVVLGSFEYNYFNTVSSSMSRIDGVIRSDGSLMAEKVQGFIDGAWAQLRLQNTIAKKQNVRAILFEDLDEDSPTFGAMSLGTQGLQISRQRTIDGRDWEWSTALTAKGLIAEIIIAGILADKTGESYWNLDTGELNLTGEIKANSGKVGGWKISKTAMYSDYETPEASYRVYVQSFLEKYGEDTWIYSVQKSTDGGNTFYSLFKILGNGELHSGSECWAKRLRATGDKGGTYDTELSVVGNAIVSNDMDVYGTFYAAKGSIASSDRKLKDNIKALSYDEAHSFIMALKPSEFVYKDEPETIRHGFIAQDVKRAMGEHKWGVYEDVEIKQPVSVDEVEKERVASIRYDEIIADLVKVVQMQDKKIESLQMKFVELGGGATC